MIYHKKISRFINNSDIDKTFVYGHKAEVTFQGLKKNKKGKVVEDLKTFNETISRFIENGDFLMIKGSNATNLHKISKEFLKGGPYAV